jgi:hypothetical protein
MFRRLFITLAFILMACGVQAQGFRCELLSRLASGIGYKPSPDAVGDVRVGMVENKPVHARFSAPGQVDHLGIVLFQDDVRDCFSPFVCDFLERYFLDLFLWRETSLEQKMRDDHVFFSSGIPYDIREVTPSTTFSLTREGDEYRASWDLGNGRHLDLHFPVDYELLTGMPQIEMERTLRAALVRASDAFVPRPLPSSWEVVDGKIHASLPSRHYYLAAMNDRVYAEQSASGQYRLLSDGRYPAFSAANLLLGYLGKHCRLLVRQRMYGFQAEEYEISLFQWLSYCREQGMTLYFSVESERGDELLALVIAVNPDLGYNHMLSVAIPAGFMDRDKPALKVKLDAFIPTHNVSDLFQELQGNPNNMVR